MRREVTCLYGTGFRDLLNILFTREKESLLYMFYNMGFTDDELKFLFSESNRVLKYKGLLSFSVRNDNYIMYKKGTKIAENIYDINGFQIRFFTKQDIKFFINDNFKIQNIIKGHEDPANLYFVICYKN